MKKKFGVLGEPLVLGVIVGMLIGLVARLDVKKILILGVTMGAVMELIPRITKLFIEGLMPISEKTKELVNRRFHGKQVFIGMSPALVIGHPTALVCTLLLIPVYLLIAVFLPGNQFLPLASLAGLFYLFPLMLPYTKGNVVRTFIVGLVALTAGLWFVTDMAADFTSAAATVYASTGELTAKVPEGFMAGSMDFSSSLYGYVIYAACKYAKFVGAGLLAVLALGLMAWNRCLIVREERATEDLIANGKERE